MNESFLANQINNTLEQKPRIRWKSSIFLFFLSLFAIHYYSFGYWEIDIFFDVDFLSVIFLFIPAALNSLIYIFSLYRAEKMLVKGNFGWKRLIILNFVITTILYILAFLFTFTFLVGLFVEVKQGAFESFALSVIYFIAAAVIIFSLVPSLVLKKFYPNTSKVNKSLFIFFLTATVIVFAYSWVISSNCNSDRDLECVANKAEEVNNFKICEKIEQQGKRNECYYGVAYENNSPQACGEIDSQYNVGGPYSRDDCYYNVFLKFDLKDKALCYKISSQKIKNSCLTSVAGNTGDESLCQSEELDNKDKQRCRDEVARSSALLKKDHSLCENIKSSGIGASMKDYCYFDVVTEAGVKEAGICQKINNDYLSYSCFVNVAKNLKNIDICDNLPSSKNSSFGKDKCIERYNEQ